MSRIPCSKPCAYCGKLPSVDPPARFQVCAKCRGPAYCSKDCQAAAWSDHKLKCTNKRRCRRSITKDEPFTPADITDSSDL